MSALQCDMHTECKDPVTHIGNRGYIYCREHALQRRIGGHERTRKMTAAELKTIKAGKPLARY